MGTTKYVDSNGEEKVYDPKDDMVDVSRVDVPEELMPLKAALRSHLHGVWAEGRIGQGWSYGPKRDDDKKFHPDLKPSSELTEEESAYDDRSAEGTIRLIIASGFKIVPAE